MASVDERRAGFKRYKEDVQTRGKPFFPYAMFHDTVMSLVVVCVIVALATIWKYTHLLGVLYTDKADPGTTSFVPRPDWYFYFLFYLLRIFKWPESVILARIQQQDEIGFASAPRVVVELQPLMPVDGTVGVAHFHKDWRLEVLDLCDR